MQRRKFRYVQPSCRFEDHSMKYKPWWLIPRDGQAELINVWA